MATKNNPGNFDRYKNADPDEPMFILLGRDQSAPDKVRRWAREREELIGFGIKPESDRAKVIEAYEVANQMEEWRRKLVGSKE